jgi:solute carrier family 25 carnitine/acylcarnitine transporter 20/29
VTLNKEKGVGSVAMARTILKEHGLRKLYMGFVPTIIRESVGLGFYFGVYDLVIKRFTENGKVNLAGSLVAGACAGIGFWAFIYPVDYIKTLLQGDSLTKPVYNGMTHCAREEMKKGYEVFFRGFGIMMARACVVNAFGFLCFEVGKKIVY